MGDLGSSAGIHSRFVFFRLILFLFNFDACIFSAT